MEGSVKGRVLVVESAARPWASGLTRMGFEVRSTSKEPVALALAAKEPFDVLVVDLSLRGLNGLSLVSRLRERAPAATVVWMTAKYTNDLAAQAAEAGVFQVLQKPAHPKALARAVTAAARQTRHLLSTFRAIASPPTSPRSVPATDAKNEFGSILDAAVQEGAVVITKHDMPKAVLVSVDRVRALLAKHEPDLQALAAEFDEMVVRMRTPKARAAARDLFAATPEQFGEASVAEVSRRA
jgi:prevent-host-death family protein